jgi:hypothetical protein
MNVYSQLLKIANDLDDLELVKIADEIEEIAGSVKASVDSAPTFQPQLQGMEPTIQKHEPAEAKKEFVKDVQVDKKKKKKRKGIVEGQDYVFNLKESENE